MTWQQIIMGICNTIGITILLSVFIYYVTDRTKRRNKDSFLTVQMDALLKTIKHEQNRMYLRQFAYRAATKYFYELHTNPDLGKSRDGAFLGDLMDMFRKNTFQLEFDPPIQEPALKDFRVEFCKIVSLTYLRIKRQPEEFISERWFSMCLRQALDHTNSNNK